MSSNPFLAESLLRARQPSFGLGVEVAREERAESAATAARSRGVAKRGRARATARGRGRTAGGLLALLLAGATGGASIPVTAALAGAGSFIGQKAAIALSPDARKKFKRVGPGKFFVDPGIERERSFQFGESERDRLLREDILAGSLTDAITGGLKAKYGDGILDMLLGTRSPAGTIVPVTGGRAVPGSLPRTGGLT